MIKSNIITESLFFKGGTISENEIYSNGICNFALNDNYLFLEKGNKIKAIKYECDSEYVYKLLKTKIKIMSKSDFIKWFLDMTFAACHRERIVNYYLGQ
jgi:hypothetical protein